VHAEKRGKSDVLDRTLVGPGCWGVVNYMNVSHALSSMLFSTLLARRRAVIAQQAGSAYDLDLRFDASRNPPHELWNIRAKS
jgi:hypothetical protein